jgi:hypothetical protein
MFEQKPINLKVVYSFFQIFPRSFTRLPVWRQIHATWQFLVSEKEYGC